MPYVSVVILAAVVATGLLAGASLDQSVKQHPARKRIGAIAYSSYAEAADLADGIAQYTTLGVAAALLSVAAAVAGWRLELESVRVPAMLAAAFAVLHNAVNRARCTDDVYSTKRAWR